MVGDTYNDIIFGKNLGMKTVLIAENKNDIEADVQFKSLYSFALKLKKVE